MSCLRPLGIRAFPLGSFRLTPPRGRWSPLWRCLVLACLALGLQIAIATGQSGEPAPPAEAAEARPALGASEISDEARRWANQVTIHRDSFGTPHIDGANDAAVAFGFAYAQCEDFFWQVEDTYLLCLGRYAEAHGPRGLNSDLLHRAFEISTRSRADYESLEPELKAICRGFAEGMNYFLATHPETRPRLLSRFEPWWIVSFGRHLTLELTFRYTRLSKDFLPRSNPSISGAVGSNAWAIGPSRTRDGKAMLFANPHQPWFGFGQLYEAHLRSGEGWQFTGATFMGSPVLTMGHNDDCGWTFTVNEPDVADVWRETFDHPSDPLKYRYDGGWRDAVEWRETIRVKTSSGYTSEERVFRKTHHGPIVVKESDAVRLSANVAKLHEAFLLRQTSLMMRTRDLADFKRCMALGNFPIMNAVYADRAGAIYYLYNGAIPKRDPAFDWSSPVDGSDPRAEWRGYHTLDELPQLVDPPEAYVQNCNSSPFVTTSGANPRAADFPTYMVEDRDDDKRRAKISRRLLEEMHGVTFEDLAKAAFDTSLYWAQTELPKYAQAFEELKSSRPDLAERVRPYFEHLLNWDGRSSVTSTQTTLCVAWYEEMYGVDYPGETLRARFEDDMPARFEALEHAAIRLLATHGDWRIAWGDVHRAQRPANVADLLDLPFDDDLPSLPCAGAHGPMGIIFTQYYTPVVRIPFVKTRRRHYGVIGYTYVAVYEFGERVRGASLVQFGASGDPQSPHYMDQATLLSQGKLKPELYYWEDVLADAKRSYRPGDLAPRVEVARPRN